PGLRGRAGWRLLESVDQREGDVESNILRTHRLLGLPVVSIQERVAADQIPPFILVHAGKPQQVRRKAAKVNPRVGPLARFKPIKIETAIDSVLDAIPAEGAVNRSRRARPPELGL